MTLVVLFKCIKMLEIWPDGCRTVGKSCTYTFPLKNVPWSASEHKQNFRQSAKIAHERVRVQHSAEPMKRMRRNTFPAP